MSAKQWLVYILECSDGTYYTGITNDLIRRVEKHNSGKGAKYTRERGPVDVMYTKNMSGKSEALKEEYKIKKLSKIKKKELWTKSQ